MKVNQAFYKFLAVEEGYKTKVYPDSSGYLTIGIGHMLTKSELSSGKIYIDGLAVKYKDGLTTDQIERLADQDVMSAMTCVNGCVQVELTQNQFNVLVSLAFNIGNVAFKNSTLVKLLNAGHYDLVPAQLLRWKMSGGKPILLERRKREAELWKKG